MRILVVDDNATNHKVLRVMLTASRHDVAEAADGIEALEKLRSASFEAVFADILMGRVAQSRVVLMSGYTDDAIVRNGQLESERAFLQKPFTPAMLVQKIRDVLA